MPKLLISILSTLLLTSAVSQTRTASLYLQADYNKTIYDRTIGNNPWGIGAGLQLFLNNSRKLKPTFELTAATYLENDKVLRLDQNDQPIDDVGSMVNLLAGISYHPANRLYISMMTGPSFVSGQTCLAIKPGAGFYFSERHRWSGKISFTNVFNRDGTSGKDFGSINLSISMKLF